MPPYFPVCSKPARRNISHPVALVAPKREKSNNWEDKDEEGSVEREDVRGS
jgi:hypothetical protein